MMDKADHSTEDENYFATMTDMMVGLLFIFLIMVAFFAYKLSRQTDAENLVPRVVLEKAKKELDEQAKELQKLREELASIRQSSLARFNQNSRKARKELLTSIQKRVRAQRPELGLTIDFERGILRLQGVDLFDSASTKLLNPSTITLLAQALADEMRCHIFSLQKTIECKDATGFVESVYVEGHTDSRPLSAGRRADGIQSNLQLSARRASNTYETLILASPKLALYLNPEEQSIMSVTAFGSQRPIASNRTWEGRAKNRRIDIRIEMYNPRSEEEVAALLIHKNPTSVTPDSDRKDIQNSPTVILEEAVFPRSDSDN